ncbi:MAG: hypothetical protein A4E28_00415 [Methanocella sp. PtaU1.Bin125]|nr:MAG: hypothetical protein A4E28_00415 [Methanocella sp. PtaU1.Bin125]
MVRKSLFDLVTLSGVRRDLLFYLDEGPKSLSDIKEYLNTTSPEVSPRLKELIERNLILFEGKKYHLTPMGKTIITNFRPFFETVSVFEQESDFWNEHDITSIPNELLLRIGEIRNYMLIEDDINDINRTNTEVANLFSNSSNIFGVSCVFESNYPQICLNAARTNVPISIVLSKNIFNYVLDAYKDEIKEFIKSPNAEFYVLDENIKISHVVTDNCMLLTMFYKNNKFDAHTNLVSYDKSSINWGKDLFNYYKLKATKINEMITHSKKF